MLIVRIPATTVGRRRALGVVRALVLPAVLFSDADPISAQRVEAVHADESALVLDGLLNEAAWLKATPASGFLQREPVEGAPAMEATQVRFAYDGAALWIGARMSSANPSAIRSFVTRRDRETAAEQLIVSLDTQRDGFTAYSFGVTPAGVRLDYFHDSDFEDSRDYGYDPVWQVETRVDGAGWTAEIRIPFTQLRYSGAQRQSWGVNIVRLVPARNEASYWVLVRRNETGWSSRMGELAGLSDLRRSRRIELLPYVAASAEKRRVVNSSDPFADASASSLRVGGDLKLGIGSNLTLDATINPDFGQVEADPAEVNLSAYETFFDERRPFFTEGADLFSGGPMFYSRRIGARPPGLPDADYHENVDHTTILGAAKLTGRLPSGLSVGALAALTDEEEVATYDEAGGTFGSAVVAPRTMYGVASARQEFGADASTLGVLVTGVHRALDGGPLSDVLTRNAWSAIADSRIRWAGGKYDMSAYVGVTHVRGSTAALLALQQSSRRYWQRPDADHVAVDPDRTSMTGTLLGINHSKMAGAHWLWDVDFFQESPGLEPNDIGALSSADARGLRANVRYRDTEPGRYLRNWVVGSEHAIEWTFGGERRYTRIFPYLSFTLPNFWQVNLDGALLLGGVSDALTRGGPLMGERDARSLELELQNSNGARTRWGFEVDAGTDDAGGRSFRFEPSLTLRPGPQWELSIDPRWSDREDARQFVLSADGGPAATFGRRYVFAHVDRHEVAARLRLNYTVTPDFTLESYIEPFASSGRFHSFGELPAAGSGDLRVYGRSGTTISASPDGSHLVTVDGDMFVIEPRDFNVRSLRSNVVLRWEWRPGSTAYLVWQQDGFAENDPARVGPGDVLDAFGTQGDQFFALKISYWLPVR